MAPRGRSYDHCFRYIGAQDRRRPHINARANALVTNTIRVISSAAAYANRCADAYGSPMKLQMT